SSPNVVPVELPLDILYEDEDIIVLNKPAGMPLHPSRGNYLNSLANALASYYMKQDMPFIFRCPNRLDRDTSGVTVVAKHMVSGNMLATMVADREVTREYLAIVKGQLTPAEGTIDAPLSREDGPTIKRFVDPEHGERAITHYRTVCFRNGHTLVSLKLETGRTHQIRVHMKYIGYPLIGDYLYNPDMALIGRQALHSAHMSFAHPITGVPLSFSAPLPEDMERVLR
ncbi:MAG: RluA family pseudouridine synthase, partial [Blautia sp.]|nr:RluA family pseudouridine synthase [Blautia sp.]